MSRKKPSVKRDVVAARNAFIVDAYSKNTPIKDICAATGLTYGSVKVIAHRLGCTKKMRTVRTINEAIYCRARDFIRRHPTLATEIGRQVAELSGSSAVTKTDRLAMTARQKEVFDFIAKYTAEQGGVSPSFDEIKDYVGLRSKSGVHRIITALEERGLIRRLENRARSIVPAEAA